MDGTLIPSLNIFHGVTKIIAWYKPNLFPSTVIKRGHGVMSSSPIQPEAEILTSPSPFATPIVKTDYWHAKTYGTRG